tara:strand:+ start:91 stop:315 length:225 start_codon:yes stop_codon:yes gene_type:complete
MTKRSTVELDPRWTEGKETVRGRTVTAGEQQVPPGGLLHPEEQELHEVAPWVEVTAPSLHGMQLVLPAWSSNEL